MKETIPAPQNIKRREAYLLKHKDTLPKSYVQAELLKLAKVRAEKNLRWPVPDTRLKTQDERMKETAKTFTPVVKKPNLFNRMLGVIRPKVQKSQRGN